MRFVIDASVAVRWYLAGESHPGADAVLSRVIEAPEDFAVPELFFFEVLAVLGRTHPRPVQTYVQAFLPVVEGGVFRHPMTETLCTRAAGYVGRGLTGYDACYAGLAAELGALWITFDSRAHALLSADAVSVDLGQGLPTGW